MSLFFNLVRFCSTSAGEKLKPRPSRKSNIYNLIKSSIPVPKILQQKKHPSWEDKNITKKRIVVLGSGWGGFGFVCKINRLFYDIIMVSPRNHFLYTPLLASTTVGTLEYRCITEPIRDLDDIEYHQAKCKSIDTINKSILVRHSYDKKKEYNINYDVLIYSVGSIANDFGIPGVSQYATFLKQITDAMTIRNRIQELFELCSTPILTRQEKEKYLSIVIVGGGPTSIEFCGELHDWLMSDGTKMFPDLLDMIEASSQLLSAFSQDLAQYTLGQLRRRKVHVILNNQVVNVTSDYVELKDGYKVSYGLITWATGVAPVPLTNSLLWDKTKSGRIIIDSNLRPINLNDSNNNLNREFIYALGDCAEYTNKPLPPTAQVAQRQGYYLANMFNGLLKKDINDFNNNLINYNKNFVHNFRGMMCYIGGYKATVSLVEKDEKKKKSMTLISRFKGIKGWLFWRGVYFTMLVSLGNRILVPMFWFKTYMFGRDFSRF